MGKLTIRIERSTCRHCTRPVFTVPDDPKVGWLHYEEVSGMLRSRGRTCRTTFAAPVEVGA